MKIGIIGAGNIGGALAHAFHRAGHEVVVANSRGPETLADFERETGAKAVTVTEAAHGNDIVVVTIPMKQIETLPRDLFAKSPETIVIDTNNYYPQHRDGAIEGVENGLTESRWVSQQLNHPVIKVFNNIYAEHIATLGRPKGSADRIALPVAGDDPATKSTVMSLVDEIGFDPYDAGTIDESWRQQPGSPVYGHDFSLEKMPAALAEAKPERTPEWRANPNSPGTYESPK